MLLFTKGNPQICGALLSNAFETLKCHAPDWVSLKVGRNER